MLKDENIICISSIDWDFNWQGHQEIMSTFARNGNRVLFIENTGVRAPNFKDAQRIIKRIITWAKSFKGFRKEMENLYIYSPLILPFPYSKIARWINWHILFRALRNWIKIMDFFDPIIWVFLPTGTALDIVNNVKSKVLIYYCIADFYELVDNPKKVKKTEDELIKRSDLIFAQGKVLQDKRMCLNENVFVFPFGVKVEIFRNFQPCTDKVPEDIKDIKKPIIGYVGGIHKHIDFNLLRFISETHPEWSIVLVGPLQTNIFKFSNLKNIFLLGKKEFSELPCYINEFDVCIIPYLKSEYTATVYPTKLNEYHALGKPVVSVDLPEVNEFNKENDDLILIGRTYEEFAACISESLNNTSERLLNKRISSAEKNSWATRIEEMSKLIEDTINKKSKIQLDWCESFQELYKVARRKVLKATFILLSLYLLIFYTPLVWFLARPLKISDLPEKSDTIVVFAGGVGESGQAGQGYEERVLHAIDLYKKHFAKKLIFSSGYVYAFQETDVMKVLALSLGVPEKDIILEKRATNTFQNIKYTKEIMEEHIWNSALVVSSPYHMRRVELVYKKVAPGIKISLTPVPNSLFYGNEKKVEVKHLKAVMHEYLGILYYFIKGYI